METKTLLEFIKNSALDTKAIDPIIIDLRQKSSYADFVFICNGTSSAHNKGIVERIRYNLKQKGELALGVEGENEGEWILMDYSSIVVHVFHFDVRPKYAFEELFKDCPQEKVYEEPKSNVGR